MVHWKAHYYNICENIQTLYLELCVRSFSPPAFIPEKEHAAGTWQRSQSEHSDFIVIFLRMCHHITMGSLMKKPLEKKWVTSSTSCQNKTSGLCAFLQTITTTVIEILFKRNITRWECIALRWTDINNTKLKYSCILQFFGYTEAYQIKYTSQVQWGLFWSCRSILNETNC